MPTPLLGSEPFPHPFLSTGELPEPRPTIECSDAPMWSTYRFVPSAPPDACVRLFSQALGQYGQGFTEGHSLRHADTNMKEAGRVPAGITIEVVGVSWDVWGCAADREHLFSSGVWVFDFFHTHIDVAPASLCTGEPPPAVDGHLRSYRTYEPGTLHIPGTTSFAVLFKFDSDHRFRDECFVRCFLHAKYANAMVIG